MRKNHLVVGIVDDAPVIELWENSTIEEVEEEQFKYVEEAKLDLERDHLTIYVIDPNPEVKQLHEVLDLEWGRMSTDITYLENAPKFNRDTSFLVTELSREGGSIRIYRNTSLEQVKNEELSMLDTERYRTDEDDLVIFKFNSSDEKESVTGVWNYSNTLEI
ncbi:hypothetical protein P4575_04825 [Priestia megaterium]|uniref:hypothetical protein n=1 Tax=Priestia megaterium TaxID=1404 RepID=UPI002E1DD871|nr:hypothetical protein [Priestia megaterium]